MMMCIKHGFLVHAFLDKEGKASKTFNTSSYIKGYHPRTAIGYFSPGHYCFVVVDGRGLNSSNGLLLDDLAKDFLNHLDVNQLTILMEATVLL